MSHDPLDETILETPSYLAGPGRTVEFSSGTDEPTELEIQQAKNFLLDGETDEGAPQEFPAPDWVELALNDDLWGPPPNVSELDGEEAKRPAPTNYRVSTVRDYVERRKREEQRAEEAWASQISEGPKSKSWDELKDELDRWIRGEKDGHDQIIDFVKNKIRRTAEARGPLTEPAEKVLLGSTTAPHKEVSNTVEVFELEYRGKTFYSFAPGYAGVSHRNGWREGPLRTALCDLTGWSNVDSLEIKVRFLR